MLDSEETHDERAPSILDDNTVNGSSGKKRNRAAQVIFSY